MKKQQKTIIINSTKNISESIENVAKTISLILTKLKKKINILADFLKVDIKPSKLKHNCEIIIKNKSNFLQIINQSLKEIDEVVQNFNLQHNISPLLTQRISTSIKKGIKNLIPMNNINQINKLKKFQGTYFGQKTINSIVPNFFNFFRKQPNSNGQSCKSKDLNNIEFDFPQICTLLALIFSIEYTHHPLENTCLFFQTKLIQVRNSNNSNVELIQLRRSVIKRREKFEHEKFRWKFPKLFQLYTFNFWLSCISELLIAANKNPITLCLIVITFIVKKKILKNLTATNIFITIESIKNFIKKNNPFNSIINKNEQKTKDILDILDSLADNYIIQLKKNKDSTRDVFVKKTQTQKEN